MGKPSEISQHSLDNARKARAMLKGVDHEVATAITDLLRAFEHEELYSARFANLTLRPRRQLEKFRI